MNILIAPDSFKGSLSALEFCQIATQVIKDEYAHADIIQLPMADGGEGTLDAILASVQGRLYSVAVQNPIRHTMIAHYAILAEQQTAVIEMAQASGLPLLTAKQRNPLLTSTYGTGELILEALNQGCKHFIITLGGSATNDGGTGMLEALGVQFFDAQGKKLRMCGQALQYIASINVDSFDTRLKNCDFIIAGDVNNPLLGGQGASVIFAPQKGADASMVAILESGMKNFVEQSQHLFDSAEYLSKYAGSGAAGGMGFALMTYCQASMQSGFEWLAKINHLDKRLKEINTRPDLIITGEGCFDQQSLQGKLVGCLCQRAEHYQIPIAIICGQQQSKLDDTLLNSNIHIYCLKDQQMSLEYSMNNVKKLLQHKVLRVIINNKIN